MSTLFSLPYTIPVRPKVPLPPGYSPSKPIITSGTNPYKYVPRKYLLNIIQERNIKITGTDSILANQLIEYDQLMPEWIETLSKTSINDLSELPSHKLYLYGAIQGINFKDLPQLSNHEIIRFISVVILRKDLTPANRNTIFNILRKEGRVFAEILLYNLPIPKNCLLFLNLEQLYNLVMTLDMSKIDVPMLEKAYDRYYMLIHHPEFENLLTLYNVDDNKSLIKAALSPPHFLESIILNFDKVDLEKVASNVGMLIPTTVSNRKQYIRDNIVYYREVCDRPPEISTFPMDLLDQLSIMEIEVYLSYFKDMELFNNIMKIYIPYSHRLQLVTDLTRTFYEPTFFTPVVRCKSINDKTIMNTDIQDPSVFMVAYGTVNRYYTYELDDLYHAFYRDNETNNFRRPDNPNLKFSTQEIENLLRLLKCYTSYSEIKKLSTRIEEGLIIEREILSTDKNYRTQFSKFDSSDKNDINQFLKLIFYTGMYMRKWQGPGFKFPLDQESTMSSLNPEPKVELELGKGLEMLKQMKPDIKSFCLGLKICEYRPSGQIDTNSQPFKILWDLVITGQQCIRVSSTKFIGTSIHYLRVLFQENIDGLEISKLEYIS